MIIMRVGERKKRQLLVLHERKNHSKNKIKLTTMKVGERKKGSYLCQVGTKIILAKERKKMTIMRIEGEGKKRQLLMPHGCKYSSSKKKKNNNNNNESRRKEKTNERIRKSKARSKREKENNSDENKRKKKKGKKGVKRRV
jgi:hypothetical protein